MVVKLCKSDRQAVCIRIILAVFCNPLCTQLHGPWAKGKIAFKTRADVPELTGSKQRWYVGSRDNLSGPFADGFPET
jgi:hypothetical protein